MTPFAFNPLRSRAGFLLLVTLSGACLQAAPPSSQAPEVAQVSSGLIWDRLEEKAASDAGETELTYVFTFQNPGPKPIRITRLDTSCSCTVAEVSSLDLAPGARGSIKARLELRGMNGLVRRSVHVSTDAGSGSTQLTLEAKITPLVDAGARLAWWPVKGAPASKTLALKINRPGEVSDLAVASESPSFKATLSVSEDSRAAIVTLTPLSTDLETQGRVPVTFRFQGKVHTLYLIAAVK